MILNSPLTPLNGTPSLAARYVVPTDRKDIENPQPVQRPRVKIALIGSGTIGPRHAHFVERNSDTVLSAVVDPGSHGQTIAAQLGTPYYTSVSELLGSVDIPDAAIICTPNHTHAAISKELARKGIHLLVEKPLSDDLESGASIVEYAKAARVKLLVGHHRRFNPYIVEAKRLLPTLGKITMINGVWATQKAASYFAAPAEWRQGATGGPVLINMIHEIDVLQYLLGPITRVQAEQCASERGYEAEEGGVLILHFENGTVGSFAFCDNVPSPYNFEAAVGEEPFPLSGVDFLRIFGTQASLSLPDLKRFSYDRSKGKGWWSPLTVDVLNVDAGIPAFESQLKHFVAVIRGQEEPRCTGDEALRALLVAKAIKKAMVTGKAVEVPVSSSVSTA
jgi:predicted dehydrogenase